MARGRMVNKKISNSKRVNDLPLQAQLLFTWLIPHLDCNGCFYGSAQMIKSLVVPRKNWKKSVIEKFLVAMENSFHGETGGAHKFPLTSVKMGQVELGEPLIRRYWVQNEQYLFMPGFVDEQVGLRRDKEKPEFPTFDGKNTENVGQTVPLSRTGRGREVEVEGEVEQEDTPLNPPSVLLPSEINQNKVLDAFRANILKDSEATLTEQMEKEITGACARWSPQGVYEAIREAVVQGHPYWGYIIGILRNWEKAKKRQVSLTGNETAAQRQTKGLSS